MWKVIKSSRILIGFVIGVAVSGATAYGIGVGNTPETGYLLCANSSTKVVTFNGTLKCPSGSVRLELGGKGATGATGTRGSTGETGPAGNATQNVYYKVVTTQDVVVSSSVTSSSDIRGTIMATIYPNDMPLGFYELDAHLSGLWKNATTVASPTVSCYFQYKKDYDKDRSVVFGIAKEDFVRWTGINVNPLGELDFNTLQDDPMYLVCKASGSITGMSGMIHATPFTNFDPMKSTSPLIPKPAGSY